MRTVTILLVVFVGCVTVGQSAEPVFHPDARASYLEQIQQIGEDAKRRTEEYERQTAECNLAAMRMDCVTAMMRKAEALLTASSKEQGDKKVAFRIAGNKIYEAADELLALWFPDKYPSTQKPDKTGQSKQALPTQTTGH